MLQESWFTTWFNGGNLNGSTAFCYHKTVTFQDRSSEYIFGKAAGKVRKDPLATQPSSFPLARSQNLWETEGQCSKFLYALFQFSFLQIHVRDKMVGPYFVTLISLWQLWDNLQQFIPDFFFYRQHNLSHDLKIPTFQILKSQITTGERS